jgi:cation diffusion facilitator CzcD-associated flavoprotein CzcO
MLEAVIVGAGFSGLCAAIALKRDGIDAFVIVDKSDRIGGTWRDNTYPGAGCDVPSHLYSYSFAPNPKWSRAYGKQAEILAYLEGCVARYGLAPHLRLGQMVVRAEWTDSAWRVTTGDGTVYVARSLLLGNGALHMPQIPSIAGLESFRGHTFHSARWDHDYDLRGKRVAVIGTGASAIQFVPQIAPDVDRLHVFQRTPPWIVPKLDREMTAREQWMFEHVPGAHWLRRARLYWRLESRVIGFAYAPAVNRYGEKLVLKHLAQQVPDPTLRAQLTPSYRLGCKRVLISNDYYPAIQRPNVELVTDPIEAIEPAGVRTARGIREVDAIVFGTGFRVSEYLSPIQIVGRGGLELNDAWKKSMRNYLGIAVSGFPNLFLLLGPNTGLGHNSIIFMIECQTNYILDCLRQMTDSNTSALDLKRSSMDEYDARVQNELQATVWASTGKSWYKTKDGRITNNWSGSTIRYWWNTRRADLKNYQRLIREQKVKPAEAIQLGARPSSAA